MPTKFYVVWVGRETGVFTSRADTQKQVHEFPRARFKSFKTREEAATAYAAGAGAPTYKSAKNNAMAPSKRANATRTTPVKKQFESDGARGEEFDTQIYCDGSCDPNPGKAGSGVVVYREGRLAELWYGLYDPNGTNNTAELNAFDQALRIATADIDKGKTVQIRCDSKYSISCVTSWAFSWEKKGWKRKTEGDIKNLEIIQQAHALYKTIRAEVVVTHVKAHIGIEGNELADRMAAFGIDQRATEFCRYADTLEVEVILKFRTG